MPPGSDHAGTAKKSTAVPVGLPPLADEAEAEAHLIDDSFTFGYPGLVGIELEWLVYDKESTGTTLAPDSALRVLGAGGDGLSGVLTTEPGGQIELSSRPSDLNECIASSVADMSCLVDRAASVGIDLVGIGVDPWRPPVFQTEHPRYLAMVGQFDQQNDSGRLMLCSTASVQVSVDTGYGSRAVGDVSTKWMAANAIGPVLVAVFANSPVADSKLTGWRSYRQATWMRIDPSRTTAPRQDLPPGDAWARYALDARVVCIRRPHGLPWAAPPGLTFRDWIRSDFPQRPTLDDLRYHLTTLFPPVRPRGYLELRMIDAQPGDGWIAPVAVAEALLDDARAMDVALEETAALTDYAERCGVSPWVVAARDGVANPAFRKAATGCLEAALSGLTRRDASKEIITSVEDFAATYTDRGRMPADDIIESLSGRHA